MDCVTENIIAQLNKALMSADLSLGNKYFTQWRCIRNK